MPTRLAVVIVLFAASWFTSGCASVGSEGLPTLVDVPWVGEEEQPIRAARQAWYDGDVLGALAQAEVILDTSPAHVDAHRLRQDVLRQRGRIGRLVHESEERLAADPSDAGALYLAGRLARDDEERVRRFGRCVEVAPESFWSWLGYAFALRAVDAERSRFLYEQLYAQSNGHPLAAVALASAYRGAGEFERARAVYQRLTKSAWLEGDGMRGVGELGLAETYMMEGELGKAWAPFLEALRLRPHEPGLFTILRDFEVRGMGDERREHVLDVLRADAGRAAAFVRAGGRALYAELLVRAGRSQGALEVLEQDGEPTDPASRRVWRRLLLAEGSVARFLDVIRADLPRSLFEDESNRVRGLWLSLLDGAWDVLDGPGEQPWRDRGPAFVGALMEAGLLYEAELAAQRVLRATPAPARDRSTLATIQRELSFEGALRRIVYRAYKGAAEGSDVELDAVLDDVRRASLAILGEDVVGEPERFSVPLLGEMIDPFGPGLPAHLARYNRHLTFGQRSGSVPEGLLLTRVVVRDLPSHPELPVPTRCTEVVGENRAIRSLSGVYGGDLAGLALLNHYVVDLDAARDWAMELQRKRRIVREDGMALLDDPVPAGGPELEAWGSDWRLAVAAPDVEGGVTLAVLDMIRWHEHAHVADFFHYLPPEANLLRNVALAATGGFSAHGVESAMERRAEGAALALSPHTELVMAHVAEFLAGDRDRSAHALGFSELAGELMQELENAGLSREDCLPRWWHKLDPTTVRDAGLAILRERF